MVLRGEARCSRQIVTVTNCEGKIVSSDKPHYNMVWSTPLTLSFVYTIRVQSLFSNPSFIMLATQIRSSDASTAESGSEMEEMTSPKASRSYSQPMLTPVREEVSVYKICSSRMIGRRHIWISLMRDKPLFFNLF